MADQQFCLRWNNHQSTLISVFDTLLENGTLVDCTLAAEGQYLKAHKVVLSACSPYLEALLSLHYEKHPIVILKDVKFTELKSMMDYMYRGEVNISQDQLGTFLKAAESLQIKGLSDNGADGDARDVGSTPKAAPASRKTTTQPAISTRPAEPQRPEVAPESPNRSRDGSISPSSRKRRRIRRSSQGDDSLADSHLDTSNSCDLPSQAQSTPIVPNIPATVTSSVTTTPIKLPIVKPEQTELVNRIDTNINSLPPESGLLKEKIEPLSEPLLEPKTEYLDDMNTNDDSVEDLTLDDDDDMDGMDISNMSNMTNMSRPGPSHGNELSNQGFAPWHLGGNQTGTDEVFMAAQEAVGAHRDSQEGDSVVENGVGGDHRSASSLSQGIEVAPRSASSLSRGRGSSCESFAGFSSCEKDKKETSSSGKITEKDSKSPSKNISQKKKVKAPVVMESPAVRVGKPRSSKSKASLVWKPVMAIKEEPIDDDYESPKKGVKKSVKIENVITPSKKIKTESDDETSGKAKRVRKQKTFVDCESGDELLKGNVKSKKAMTSEIESIASTSSTLFYDSETSEEDQSTEPIQKRRSTKKEGFFKCEQCGKVYKYMRGMRQHQRLECNKEPQFPCPYCPSKFRYRQNIREHVRGSHEQAFPKWYATHYVVPLLMKENLS